MKVSCGGLIHFQGKLLICRPRWDSDKWNLPKGGPDKGETPIQAAIREIYEETNITIDEHCYITDLGATSYGKKKLLYLFHIILFQEPEELKCNSFFERDGKQIPEMVDYKWIDPSDYMLYFSDKLNRSVGILFKRL